MIRHCDEKYTCYSKIIGRLKTIIATFAEKDSHSCIENKVSCSCAQKEQ